MIRFEKDSRYYLLDITKNFFGEWEVMRAWGQKKSGLGQVRYMPFGSLGAASIAYEQLKHYRVFKRHYTVTQELEATVKEVQ